MSRVTGVISAVLVALACLSSPRIAAAESSAAEIDANATEALNELYGESEAAKSLGDRAAGMLIFPEVTKGGLIVGGEYGEGALRVSGKTVAYYSLASGSIGLQAGLQSRSQVIMFMTEEALSKFRAASGWEAGVDGSITVLEAGASGKAGTETSQKPIVAFIFGETGLMANLNLEGTKFTEIERN